MKEALIIFIILLILLMIISVFGGSIRYTPTDFAGIPQHASPASWGPGFANEGFYADAEADEKAKAHEAHEGFYAATAPGTAQGAAGQPQGSASAPTGASASTVSAGTIGGTGNITSSAGNSMGAVTVQGGTSTSQPNYLPQNASHASQASKQQQHQPDYSGGNRVVEPFGSAEFAPF